MVKAGIFGIFTDRLYFLAKIQTKNYYRCDAGLITNKETLTSYMSLVSLMKKKGRNFQIHYKIFYEATSVLMKFVVLKTLFTTIIHILKVQDNQNGI